MSPLDPQNLALWYETDEGLSILIGCAVIAAILVIVIERWMKRP